MFRAIRLAETVASVALSVSALLLVLAALGPFPARSRPAPGSWP